MAKLTVHPLMATIVDHPDLDAPRLVYADWLDEQGDPKLSMLAEYIRLGVELAAPPQSSPDRDAIKARLQELGELEREAIRPPMPKWARNSVQFQRGLPHHLRCTAQQFARGARVVECVPITSITVTGHAKFVAAAFACQELVRIRSLSVVSHVGSVGCAAMETLASNPCVANLQSLAIHSSLFSDESARVLAAAGRRFSSLTWLSMWIGQQVSLSGRQLLARAFGDRLRISGQPA